MYENYLQLYYNFDLKDKDQDIRVFHQDWFNLCNKCSYILLGTLQKLDRMNNLVLVLNHDANKLSERNGCSLYNDMTNPCLFVRDTTLN